MKCVAERKWDEEEQEDEVLGAAGGEVFMGENRR